MELEAELRSWRFIFAGVAKHAFESDEGTRDCFAVCTVFERLYREGLRIEDDAFGREVVRRCPLSSERIVRVLRRTRVLIGVADSKRVTTGEMRTAVRHVRTVGERVKV